MDGIDSDPGRWWLLGAVLAIAGCGDGGGGRSDTSGVTSLSSTSPGLSAESGRDDTAGTTASDQTGGITGGSGTTMPATDSGQADTMQVYFDVGEIPDGGGNGCGGGKGGTIEFSYIWIANSTQNAVSKIDTQTMIEEGR